MINDKKITIVGLGEVLWDLLTDGKFLGGAPANFVYYANLLGAKGYIVSCVGGDTAGMEIISRLKELKIETRWTPTSRS